MSNSTVANTRSQHIRFSRMQRATALSQPWRHIVPVDDCMGTAMIRSMIKQRLSMGLRLAWRNMRAEAKLYWLDRNGRALARRRYNGSDYKLHLGCGRQLKPGWINIDGMAKADLALDLRERLPFRDGSCSMIYTEHFLEHVDYPEPALSLLKECYRVLQANGTISIGVPDAGRSLNAYGVCDKEHFDDEQRLFHPPWCQTMMEHVNYTFRQGTEHRFAYDFETLAKALTQAGFAEVVRRPHDPDLDSRDPRGLYVMARRCSRLSS